MCRYAFTSYKTHFACFACRKVFRKLADRSSGRVDRCPDCRAPMASLGMDVNAPRRTATKQWRLLEGMFVAGHAFQTCGCIGPGLIAASTSEYRRYLDDALAGYQASRAHAKADERAYWTERVARVRRALAALR